MKKLILKSVIKVSLLTIFSLIITYVVKSSTTFTYDAIFFVMGIILFCIGVMTIAYEPNRVRSMRGNTPSFENNNVDLLFQEVEHENNKRVVGKFSLFNVIFILPAILMFLLAHFLV